MSEHKHPIPLEGIVTSDAAQAKRPKLAFVAVAIILFFLLVGGGYKLYSQYGHKSSKPSVSNKNSSSNKQKWSSDAVQQAQTQLKNATSAKDKAEAYITLAIAYENNNQNKEAISAYQNAEAADSSVKPTVLGAIGYAYARAGERDKAISAFQELINILQTDKSSPFSDAAIQGYQNDVKWLQEGKSI